MNLAINTAAFALAFAAWVVLGPSARMVGEGIGLGEVEQAWLRSIPILVGSVLRFPAGLLADRFGAAVAFPSLLLVGSAGLLVLAVSSSVVGAFVGALAVGAVGATFAVGVQSVAATTPPARRGVALGVFGAANVGAALTTFGLPWLLEGLGWRVAFGCYALVLLTGAGLYRATVRSPVGAALCFRERLRPLGVASTWRYGFYYMATFGAFVALTLVVTDLYVDRHAIGLALAGALATTFTFSSSLARIPGGWLADRFGGGVVLRASLAVVALALIPLGLVLQADLHLGTGFTVGSVFVAGVAMGVGMAAVYQELSTHYAGEVGAAGGAVGSLGGLAGFYLPLFGAYLGAPVLVVGSLAAVALGLHLYADGAAASGKARPTCSNNAP